MKNVQQQLVVLLQADHFLSIDLLYLACPQNSLNMSARKCSPSLSDAVLDQFYRNYPVAVNYLRTRFNCTAHANLIEFHMRTHNTHCDAIQIDFRSIH